MIWTCALIPQCLCHCHFICSSHLCLLFLPNNFQRSTPKAIWITWGILAISIREKNCSHLSLIKLWSCKSNIWATHDICPIATHYRIWMEIQNEKDCVRPCSQQKNSSIFHKGTWNIFCLIKTEICSLRNLIGKKMRPLYFFCCYRDRKKHWSLIQQRNCILRKSNFIIIGFSMATFILKYKESYTVMSNFERHQFSTCRTFICWK